VQSKHPALGRKTARDVRQCYGTYPSAIHAVNNGISRDSNIFRPCDERRNHYQTANVSLRRGAS